ncbi:MAG: hypothetical protein ABII98_01375, partial [bacterium]
MKRIQMSNKKYGALTALRFIENGSNGARWEFLCDCGNKKIIDGYLVRRGSVRTCGCGIGIKNNFIGKRFGKLLIIKRMGVSKDRSLIWEARCDCGNVIKIASKYLLSGGTKSCGCLRKIEKGEANFNKLYSGYKNSAQKRGLAFLLSKDEFRKIIGENCSYCGIEPKQKLNRRFSNGEYLFNGIDRRDNLLGYTKKNSLPCCFVCNRAKGDMT